MPSKVYRRIFDRYCPSTAILDGLGKWKKREKSGRDGERGKGGGSRREMEDEQQGWMEVR
jgi:hypothetical protein